MGNLIALIPDSRILNWLIAAGCVFLMAVALYMEHQMQLEPCPLCVFQRVAVIATGLIAFIAAVHNPAEKGIRIYGALTGIAAVTGAVLSGRQLWLQSLPEDEVPACGPGLEYLMDVFTPMEVFEMVFAGDGTCAEVVWTDPVIGLSIPGWTMVGFVGLIAFGLFQMARPQTRSQKSPALA